MRETMPDQRAVCLTAFECEFARENFPLLSERDAYIEVAKLKQSGELAKLMDDVMRLANPGTLPTFPFG